MFSNSAMEQFELVLEKELDNLDPSAKDALTSAFGNAVKKTKKSKS
jgi:hypothetical protein